jgi:hypothetical protein
MPAQSGTSEIKPGRNWINRGSDCGTTFYALAAWMPRVSTPMVHIEAAVPFN